jgi:hypothetical protein
MVTQDLKSPAPSPDSIQFTVLTWLKNVNQWVESGETVVELKEGEKVVQVQAAAAGVLKEIFFENDAFVEPGRVLGKIEQCRPPMVTPRMRLLAATSSLVIASIGGALVGLKALTFEQVAFWVAGAAFLAPSLIHLILVKFVEPSRKQPDTSG